MADLDTYLPSYITFRCFCRVYCPGTAERRIKEAVIKSAASAASLGFARERQDDGPACGRRGTGRSPANPREAALAAGLITASLIRLLVMPGQYSDSPFARNGLEGVRTGVHRLENRKVAVPIHPSPFCGSSPNLKLKKWTWIWPLGGQIYVCRLNGTRTLPGRLR